MNTYCVNNDFGLKSDAKEYTYLVEEDDDSKKENVEKDEGNNENLLQKEKSDKNEEQLNMENRKDTNTYKLKAILLGNIAVGKTALLNRYALNKFSSEYCSSIGVEFKIKTISIDDSNVVDIQIWDTCGQEKFRTLTRQYYREANLVMLVFDLTSKSSFKEVINWINDVKEHGPKECLCVLIGNKSDLSSRAVNFGEAVDFAKMYGMDYFEVSAKTGSGIKFMFDIMSRSYIKAMDEGTTYSNFDKFDKRRSRSGSLVVVPIKGKKSGCC